MIGTAMLDVDGVTIGFDGNTVLDGVSLHVDDGEIVALLGPSGSGKSTLLRVIAGIVPAQRGRVLLDGRDITDLATHRRAIGMVFQDEQLFPHLSVADNVAFGLRMIGVGRSLRAERVDELLALVGLSGFGERRIEGLSGGERKRVALARSLAPRPRLLLLDEPLTGLDRELHDRLAGEVRAILTATGTTALWVTHDAAEAATVASRTLHLPDLSVRRVPGELVELRAADTHDLRRRVLRSGTPSDVVVFDGDEQESTFHLGWRVDGELVATSTWIDRPYPDLPTEHAFQVRGMATAPALRGRGIGALLLAAGFDRCHAAGATTVWAHARDTALEFYLRHGFRTHGPGYVDLDTGLPHHDVIHRLP